MNNLHILATGRCTPKKAVSNDDLSKIVDTSDEWITTRTGIKQRYFCEEENNVYLAVHAAAQAIERAGIAKEEIGLCVVATLTPDYATPSTACILQRELGLPEDIPAFDINAACSGFLYGLQVVDCMLPQLNRKYALLIGCEVLTKIMDMEDRSTCVLFGDGAGAAVIEASDRHKYYGSLGARGNTEYLYCKGINSKEPSVIHMNGKEVFRFAVDIIPRCIDTILTKANLTLEDIDYVVCHQANERIISHVIKKLKAPPEKFYINLQRYGNTSSASIPIALDEMNCNGLLTPGKKVLCVGFGAGFTWGGALLEW